MYRFEVVVLVAGLCSACATGGGGRAPGTQSAERAEVFAATPAGQVASAQTAPSLQLMAAKAPPAQLMAAKACAGADEPVATIEHAPPALVLEPAPERCAELVATIEHAPLRRGGSSASQLADTLPPSAAGGGALLADSARADDGARYVDVVTEQGQRAHGVYFTALMTRRLGAQGIVRMVRGAGLDAAVIDLKDQDGRVSYDTRVEALQLEKQILVRDMPGLLRELKAGGIYTIARVVCFSDPVLPRRMPDRAVLDSRPNRGGEIWNQRHTNTWLDPYNVKNHDMVVGIAVEAETLGFDEVQLDYIRFPVDEGTKFAMFPAQGDKPRREVLLGLLARVDEAIHIPLGVDVFGLTTIRAGDPAGLGQSLEDWAKHVEVFTPMLYVNGMKGWMRHKSEGRAGSLVEVAVRTLRERVGPAPVIRPFLQAFEAGADYYNGAFITEQIRGVRTGGGDGFLFWHPASSYGVVREAIAGGARGEFPATSSERREARQQIWRRLEREPQAALPAGVATKPAS